MSGSIMRIAVRKEDAAGERRVALVPDSVKRLAGKKLDVSIESGAGAAAFASDEDYKAMGARVDGSHDALVADADAVLQIRPPTLEEIGRLKEGSALVSLLYPLVN